MNRFIGIMLGMVLAAQVAIAGTMPSLEVSGSGVVISATKVGQIASITTVHTGRVSSTNANIYNISSTIQDVSTLRATSVLLTNVSGTIADITVLRAGTISATGTVSTTGSIYSGGLLTANSGVSTSSIATLSSINGISVTTSNISFMSGMNQSVSTTNSPTFAGLNLSGLLSGQGISGTVVSASTNFSGKGALFQHCTYNASSSTVISTNGLNCGSITRISAGYYGVSFTTPAADPSYTVIATSSNISPTFVTQDTTIAPATTGYALRVTNVSGTIQDTSRLNIMVTR